MLHKGGTDWIWFLAPRPPLTIHNVSGFDMTHTQNTAARFHDTFNCIPTNGFAYNMILKGNMSTGPEFTEKKCDIKTESCLPYIIQAYFLSTTFDLTSPSALSF